MVWDLIHSQSGRNLAAKTSTCHRCCAPDFLFVCVYIYTLYTLYTLYTCICICVCICICICTCICICIWLYMYICMYIYVYLFIYLQLNINSIVIHCIYVYVMLDILSRCISFSTPFLLEQHTIAMDANRQSSLDLVSNWGSHISWYQTGHHLNINSPSTDCCRQFHHQFSPPPLR